MGDLRRRRPGQGAEQAGRPCPCDPLQGLYPRQGRGAEATDDRRRGGAALLHRSGKRRAESHRLREVGL